MTNVIAATATQAYRKPRTFKFSFDLLIQWAVIAALFGGWYILGRLEIFDPFLLPPLGDVLQRLWSDVVDGPALGDLGLTLYRAMLAFVISTIIGVPIGIMMARNAFCRWFFDPLVSIGFPMPKIAFLPIFILWFGLFDTSKIIMVVFSCIFPIITATYAGTLGIDKWPVWSARALGARSTDLLWEVVLPLALPQVLTGMQIALPTSLITTLVTEMMMSGRGIGATMMQAGRFADSPGVFAGILEIGILGFALVFGLERLRQYLLAWHPESRR